MFRKTRVALASTLVNRHSNRNLHDLTRLSAFSPPTPPLFSFLGLLFTRATFNPEFSGGRED